MSKDIHPEYKEIKATCSCGNVIKVKSTLKEDINLDVCSSCHPFYTGKQKLVDTGGRVERFEKRFGKKGKERSGSSVKVVVEEEKETKEQKTDTTQSVKEKKKEKPKATEEKKKAQKKRMKRNEQNLQEIWRKDD